MPPMNAKPPFDFQRPPFPSQVPLKFNLEAMIESMLMAQQKQDEYIKRLTSKVDVLTNHNKILEAHIFQQASFSSTPPDRLSSNPEPNPHEKCNCVTLKEEVEDFIDPENIPMQEAREIIMARSKEKNDSGKTATLIENDTIEIPIIFPPKLPIPSSFSIPCVVGKVEIERALCDRGANVSIMPYSLFHKLHLGPLQVATLSLQLADGYEAQPIGRFDNVPVDIEDIWVFEEFIIVDMPKTNDAQIILGRPILAIASCHIEVRKGHITFDVEWRYVVFCHMKGKKKVVSPNSSQLDEFSSFP